MSFGNCEEEGHDERWGELKKLDAAEIKDPTTKDFRVVAVFREILVEVRLTKSSKKRSKIFGPAKHWGVGTPKSLVVLTQNSVIEWL